MQMAQLPCRLKIYGGPVAEETIPGGRISPARNIHGWFDIVNELRIGGKWRDGTQRRELKRRLKQASIDVLLANYGPTGVALLPVCLDLDIPLVVHFHGYDAHKADVVTMHRDDYQDLGRSASAVIAVSQHMNQALVSYGIPQDRIHVLRYGCDPNSFTERQSSPSTPTFFGVGRFTEKKAPYLTVLAFAKVVMQFPSARLILAGTGELLEASQNLAICLGIGSAVHFPGVLSHTEVANYMQTATAFVQHSICPKTGPWKGDCEGTPVAVIEAMMTGLPVVSTRHAGINEVVEDGRTGLLVGERDVEGMAEAMCKLAGDIELNASLGRAARQKALNKYTANDYTSSILRVLSNF